MDTFLTSWHEASITSLGFFWMAFWAFGLGYLVSSLIQVLITRDQMRNTMGSSGPRSMALGTLFGFISSSCSFAALSTTRSLFAKGAGLAPSMAFMLASTNLVVELGIVIAIFLSWQFVVGEYVGGILLILVVWALIRITRPKRLVERARQRLEDQQSAAETSLTWRELLRSKDGWTRVGQTYVMEWHMVWKDVLIGFTVAGVIAAFVPDAFFATLFVGSAESESAGFSQILLQTVIGPLAAFFTFIGSMGNIPLAALLFERGVSFAGVMAFIFSDLVVFPVLRINAEYYGWKMALYLTGLLLTGLVIVSLLLHYGFDALGMLPQAGSGNGTDTQREFFSVNYGLFLNLAFIAVSVGMIWLWRRSASAHGHGGQSEGKGNDQNVSLAAWASRGVVIFAVLWLAGGLVAGVALGEWRA